MKLKKDPFPEKIFTKEETNPSIEYPSMNYDDRSGPSISAGDWHGVGKRQPVGHSGNPTDSPLNS